MNQSNYIVTCPESIYFKHNHFSQTRITNINAIIIVSGITNLYVQYDKVIARLVSMQRTVLIKKRIPQVSTSIVSICLTYTTHAQL